MASGGTVILGVLCLLFSDLGSNRGLGPISAVSIALAVLAALTFLPAVLVLLGRAAFWPFRPRYGDQHEHGRGWQRVADGVGRRPGRYLEADDITEALRPSAVPVVGTAEGVAVVEAMTVFHERDLGAVSAPVIARLPDGSRVGARAEDPELPAAVSRASLVGREVKLRTDGGVTTYTLV